MRAMAGAGWVAWWNGERLHGACGDVPPSEFEAAYWQRQEAPIAVAKPKPSSLHETQGDS
jgi:hypothetical protein